MRKGKHMILEDDIKRVIQDINIQWELLKEKSILVTGATGLIGSLCIKVLQELDFHTEIFALVRDEAKAREVLGNKIHYVIGDVRNSIKAEISPDYIIHCASNTKSKVMIDAPVDTLDISIVGTMNLLRFAVRSKVKGFVYISSMEAYGVTEEDQNPVTEEKLGYIDLTAARSSYSEGKRASECLCTAFFHQYQVPVKIARLALTMGAGIPKTDNRVSMQFARSAVNGDDIVLHTAGKSI